MNLRIEKTLPIDNMSTDASMSVPIKKDRLDWLQNEIMRMYEENSPHPVPLETKKWKAWYTAVAAITALAILRITWCGYRHFFPDKDSNKKQQP